MTPGLYVHLPYCATRCGYCAFVVTTDRSSQDAYLSAVVAEADLLAGEAAGCSFDTVYLGGGTPSLLPGDRIARLLANLASRLPRRDGAEVTLEANPEDVTAENLAAWAAAGVTRLSVGIQSLNDRELSAVGRSHDANRARAALAVAAGRGFSVSADLILGLPEQTPASFLGSLEGVGGTGVDHLSVYLLETDKSKSLEEDRRLRPLRYLSDDAQADLWLEAGERLAALGFEHYEISNWARPGRAARHNQKYWERTPTLGLGVAAHELWRGRRRANVSGIPGYLAAVASGRRPTALDRTVSLPEEAQERIVLGLRLARGVPAPELESWISAFGDDRLLEDYGSWKEAGILSSRAGRVTFTERGFLLSNEVLCRFA